LLYIVQKYSAVWIVIIAVIVQSLFSYGAKEISYKCALEHFRKTAIWQTQVYMTG